VCFNRPFRFPADMVLDGILERITKKSPVPVMARAAMEFALRDEDLDRLFVEAADRQYTRTLFFSTLVGLMVLAVSRSRASVRAAFLVMKGEIGVTLQAVYDKLNGLETPVSQRLLRHVAGRLGGVIEWTVHARP